MEKIKTIIVDSNSLFRTSLIYTLKKYREIEIIDEASNGIESLIKVRRLMPDVMVMEAKIDCREIISTTQLSKDMFPEMKIIAITFRKDEEIINRLFREGINGIVFKDTSVREISRAIIKVKHNEKYVPKIINGKTS